MKEIFPEYHPLSDKNYKKLWDEGIFVFDANVLLNLYRYSVSTVKDLLDIFKIIEDRLWLPYQIALEYQENRLNVILEQEEKYKKIIQDIKESPIKIIKDLDKNLEKYNSRIENDDILQELNHLYNGKVGNPYTDEQRAEYENSAEKRFKKLIPPGYKDKDKTINERYGDVIIWLNVIEKAKALKKHLVFVTDDDKEDWWLVVRGRTISPRPELLREFGKETKQLFWMYSSRKFIEYAKEYLKKDIKQNTIDEIEKQQKEIKGKGLLEAMIQRLEQQEAEKLQIGIENQKKIKEWLKRAQGATTIDWDKLLRKREEKNDLGSHEDNKSEENNDK